MNRNLTALAVRNIASRRTRSWLTILGVLIGVTAVVALISIGTGVQKAVLQQFEAIGYDVLLIVPQTGWSGAIGATAGRMGGQFDPTQLRVRPTAMSTATHIDPELLVEQVPTLTEAGNLTTQIVSVESEAAGGYLRVTSPSASFLEAFAAVLGGFTVEQGRGFADPSAREVVVGARSAERLEVSVGDELIVDRGRYTVVGILAPAPESLEDSPLETLEVAQSTGDVGDVAPLLLRGLSNTDDTLFVLEEQALSFQSGSEAFSTTVTRVETGASVTDAKASIVAALEQQGIVGTPISVEEIADSIQGTLGMVETVLASIAAVALVVGGVGLMNTMYTSVLERTREIGVLKAIGARDGQVLWLFLIDSGLMGLIGGVLGLVTGCLFSILGTRLLGPVLGVPSFAPIFTASLVLGVLFASFALGSLAGVLPAWRAARQNPVEALGSE